MLDESTSAAEAMTMARAIVSPDGAKKSFFVADDCHPQTIAVVVARAEPLGISVKVGPTSQIDLSSNDSSESYCNTRRPMGASSTTPM